MKKNNPKNPQNTLSFTPHPSHLRSFVAVKNLYKNRFGVFYLRFRAGSIDRRISLHTKDKHIATRAILSMLIDMTVDTTGVPAMEFDPKKLQDSLKNRKDWTIETPGGIKIKGEANEVEQFKSALKFVEAQESVRRVLVSPTPTQAPKVQEGPEKTGLIKLHLPIYRNHLLHINLGKDKATARNTRYIDEQIRALNDFIEIAKLENRDLNAITIKDAAKFRSHLLDVDKLSGPTVNKKLGSCQLFFTEQIQRQTYTHDNPFLSIKRLPKSKNRKGHLAFSFDEFKLMFDKTTYLSYASPRNKLQLAFYWIPLVLLYTGCSNEEVAGLKKGCVQKDEIGQYFMIVDESNAKNFHRQRRVPLARELLDNGFEAYIDERLEKLKDKPADHPLFFDKMKDNKNGYNHAVSKRFTDFLIQPLAAKELINPKKTLVIFRHTMVNYLKIKNINDGLARALVGHDEQNDVHSNYYQSSDSVGTYQEIRKIVNDFKFNLPIFQK